MLDNPEKTARLLAALKAAVPFKVELVPSLVAYLRAQHVAIVDRSSRESLFTFCPQFALQWHEA
jgi:hypothetical protein